MNKTKEQFNREMQYVCSAMSLFKNLGFAARMMRYCAEFAKYR